MTVALRTVTDESKSVVLEIVLKFGQGPIAPFIHHFFGTGKVEGLDSTDALCKKTFTFGLIKRTEDEPEWLAARKQAWLSLELARNTRRSVQVSPRRLPV